MDWYPINSDVGEGQSSRKTTASLVPGGVVVLNQTFNRGGAGPALSESMVFVPGDLGIARASTGTGYEIVHAIRNNGMAQSELIGKLVNAAVASSSAMSVDRVDLAMRIREILDAEKQ